MIDSAGLLARLVVVSTTAALTLIGSSAAADGSQVALAEALFRSGRELMAAGKFAEACPKLAESNRIDPKLGTLMNLALCHESAGKTASAWGEYLEAADIASKVGQTERVTVAKERASALEPTLPHVVIDEGGATDAAVTLDDQTIQSGAFGTPIPLDPGSHSLRASAPGKKAFVESFAVQANAPPVTIHIPSLADESAVPSPPPAARPFPPAAESRASVSSSQRTWGWVVGGTGVAAVGVGAIFGVSAFSEKQTVENQCNASLRCTSPGDQAKTSLSAPPGGSSARAATTLRIGPDVAARGVRMEVSW
jgi:hypothetical protein